MNFDDLVFRDGKAAKTEFEYFCFGCGQLRLSFVDIDTCGNCGSKQIRKAAIGTLNKEKLKNEFSTSKRS